jgi:hypothetical protein
MKKVTISTTYNVKYFVSDDICLTECGKYINVKKGIELKTFLRGNKKAIYVNGVAQFTEDLKPVERIVCPF